MIPVVALYVPMEDFRDMCNNLLILLLDNCYIFNSFIFLQRFINKFFTHLLSSVYFGIIVR